MNNSFDWEAFNRQRTLAGESLYDFYEFICDYDEEGRFQVSLENNGRLFITGADGNEYEVILQKVKKD